MPDQTRLEQMQEAAKRRCSRLLGNVVFFDAPPVEVKPKRKVGRPKKPEPILAPKPSLPPRITWLKPPPKPKKHLVSPVVHEDKPKPPIIREKGNYTNIPSPYGLATELLNEKTG